MIQALPAQLMYVPLILTRAPVELVTAESRIAGI